MLREHARRLSGRGRSVALVDMLHGPGADVTERGIDVPTFEAGNAEGGGLFVSMTFPVANA